MDLGRAFISSVFGGLLDLRAEAAAAAGLAGFEPVLTERHVAQPGSVRDALAREIAACDVYVGLFAERRGTVPAAGTQDHRAITEEEFRLAREQGLRCLVFLSRAGAGSREPGLAEFLDAEVTSYEGGLWTRPYDDPASLRRELVAALAALRPRIVLALTRTPAGVEAVLHLAGVKPAWSGEERVGPMPAALDLPPAAAHTLAAFRAGEESRNRLDEAALRAAGGELARAALPGRLGEACADVLDLAAAAGRLLVLEVRTADPEALDLPWELLSPPRHSLAVRTGLLEIVRRVSTPGPAAGPEGDPAASVPPPHLTLLGFTAAPIEDLATEGRPGWGGFADADLFWEREQERLLRALDPLLREGRGSLILSETGDREELRAQITRKDRPRVVHIACHGGLAGGPPPDGEPVPVLLLEDREGRRAPLAAPDLLSWARATPGAADCDLLVLAACNTAGIPGASSPGPGSRTTVDAAAAGARPSAAGQAPGYAQALVSGGLARVLGMQSTISDEGATAFAGGFYGCLARGADLPAALRAGRVELAAQGRAHEWAVPTLLSRRDAGPLAAPEGSAPPAATPFELARRDFAIAGVSYLGEGYVGRRDAERKLRRAFLRGERVLVIHGLGGMGKSTLAARLLERRHAEGARVLVAYAGRALAPEVLFEEVAAKLGVARGAGLSAEQAEASFRADLGQSLAAVVPTLLLLDNFEDNQDGEGGFRNPALGEALGNLVQLGGPGFRLLVTSRLRLELPPPLEAWNLDLGELSASGCRKLRLTDREGLGSLDEQAWRQVLRHLGGHPKALELLGGYLRSDPDRARALLADLGAAVEAVDRKLAAERQERGRSLLIAAVLAEVPAERRPAFDRLCLLEEPLPGEELAALLAAEGLGHASADLAWLRGHGLLARTVSPSALAGGDAVHRLLASRRQGALAEREGEDAARAWHRRVAEHLVERRGPASDLGAAARHRDAAGDRAEALELYDRWAKGLLHAYAFAACLEVAREGLDRFPPGGSEQDRVAAAGLWCRIYDALQPLGAVEDARQALDQALRLVEGAASPAAVFKLASVRLRKGRDLARAGRRREAETELNCAMAGFGDGGQVRDRALALGELAKLRASAGDIPSAMALLEEERRTYEQLGDLRERAMVTGEIGRLLERLGEVSQALSLQEEALRVFEQAGDVRSRAVALSDIAWLRAQSGETALALELLDEVLRICEQLGDVPNRAGALGSIARVRSQRGEWQAALDLQQERLRACEQIGDAEGHASAVAEIARLRIRLGDLAGACAPCEQALREFEAIGDVRGRAAALGDLANLRAMTGDPGGALPLQQERLEVYRRIQDPDGVAATQFDLARLEVLKGRHAAALARLAESWEINLRINRAEGIAAVGALYGRLLAASDRPHASEVLRRSRDAYRLLGMTDPESEALLARLESAPAAAKPGLLARLLGRGRGAKE